MTDFYDLHDYLDRRGLEGPDDRPDPPDSAYDEGGFVDQSPERKSAFFPASDFDGQPVPPRQWLVDDLIPSGTVTLLGGDGGTGKSLLALQLAVAAATGGEWIGRAVNGGASVYISAEDDRDELHRRLNDITRGQEGSLADLDRMTVRSLAGEDALLALAAPGSVVLSPTGLFKELDAYLTEQEPVLLVLDTLADLFPGNENDRSQARQFIGLLRGLAIRHRCAVVLLAHPSLSGLSSGSGTSGSTAWNNSVRSRLYFKRVIDEDQSESDPDARVLEAKKSNYSRIGTEIALRWHNGAFIPAQGEDSFDRIARNAKAEKVFLHLLDELTQQGRYVSPSYSRTYAPNVFAEHPRSEKITRKAFTAAMETLLQRGTIEVAEQGPASKRRQYIRRSGVSDGGKCDA